MEQKKSVLVEVQIGKILASVFLIAIGIPLMIGVLLGIPLTSVLSFIGSIAVFQALAAPVGVILDFDPWVVLSIMTVFAFGICLAIWESLQTFALTSDRVSRWIARIEKNMQEHQSLHRYGPVSCILIAWIPGIGLYGTPAIAWILRWDRIPSVIFTVTGFFLASLLIIIIAEGASIIIG
ncbi:MAG: small multi-drug export protein [Methanoregulaceae archaeon]|jgi:hypothetical protein|nr:small multi-drug export protein [Methanoregulaceae archaeon]MCU0628622.1 small multi-drug export protein [Methanoregulaceae archaeon]